MTKEKMPNESVRIALLSGPDAETLCDNRLGAEGRRVKYTGMRIAQLHR